MVFSLKKMIKAYIFTLAEPLFEFWRELIILVTTFIVIQVYFVKRIRTIKIICLEKWRKQFG